MKKLNLTSIALSAVAISFTSCKSPRITEMSKNYLPPAIVRPSSSSSVAPYAPRFGDCSEINPDKQYCDPNDPNSPCYVPGAK